MGDVVVYGPGGLDETKPNNNIVEKLVDNQDGSGTLFVYDETGEVVDEAVVAIPVEEEMSTNSVEVLSGAVDALEASGAPQTVVDVIRALVQVL